MKVELKKNCRKYMFRACMVLLCSLLFVGVITLSPNIVHAAEEAGTEAATIEDVTDVVDTSDMGTFGKIFWNMIVDMTAALYDALQWLLSLLIGNITDIIMQTGNGITGFYCFSFDEGNVYGVISAIAYSLIRGIAFLVLSVQLIFAIVQAIVGVSTGERAAQLKSSIGSIVTSFLILALAPKLLTETIHVRNQLTSTIITQVYGAENADLGNAVSVACANIAIVGFFIFLAYLLFCIRLAIDYTFIALSCVVGMISLPFCCMLGPQSIKSRLSNWISMMASNLMTPVIDTLLLAVPCTILKVDISLSSINLQVGRIFCVVACCFGIQPARSWFQRWLGVSDTGALSASGQTARMAQAALRAGKNAVDDWKKKRDEANLQEQQANVQEAFAGAEPLSAQYGQQADDFNGVPQEQAMEQNSQDTGDSTDAIKDGAFASGQSTGQSADNESQFNVPTDEPMAMPEEQAGKLPEEVAGGEEHLSGDQNATADHNAGAMAETSSDAVDNTTDANTETATPQGATEPTTFAPQNDTSAEVGEKTETQTVPLGQTSDAETDAENGEVSANATNPSGQSAEMENTTVGGQEPTASTESKDAADTDAEGNPLAGKQTSSAAVDAQPGEASADEITESAVADSEAGATPSEQAMVETDGADATTEEGTAQENAGAYDGFTVGNLPRDEQSLVAMQGNLEQQEQQARSDAILMRRKKRELSGRKQDLQHQRASNDAEYRIRESGLQAQVAEANLAEEKAKAQCLARGTKPNDDPEVQAYRQTAKQLTNDLKGLQTEHQVANAALDKQIQSVDRQMAVCDGAIEDTNEQIAQIQDAKAQVQDARKEINQTGGQHYQASSAAANVQIAQNKALARIANVDNFEQPMVYAALSPEQRAQFHRQKAQALRKERRGEIAGSIVGGMTGAIVGSMAGGIEGSILTGQIGADIGSDFGRKHGAIAAVAAPAAVAAAPYILASSVAEPTSVPVVTATGVGMVRAGRQANLIRQEEKKAGHFTSGGGSYPINTSASSSLPVALSNNIVSASGSPYQSRVGMVSQYAAQSTYMPSGAKFLTPKDRMDCFEQQRKNYRQYYEQFRGGSNSGMSGNTQQNSSSQKTSDTQQNTQPTNSSSQAKVYKPLPVCYKFSNIADTLRNNVGKRDKKQSNDYKQMRNQLAEAIVRSNQPILDYYPTRGSDKQKLVHANTAAQKLLEMSLQINNLLSADDKMALKNRNQTASIANRLYNTYPAEIKNLIGDDSTNDLFNSSRNDIKIKEEAKNDIISQLQIALQLVDFSDQDQ